MQTRLAYLLFVTAIATGGCNDTTADPSVAGGVSTSSAPTECDAGAEPACEIDASYNPQIVPANFVSVVDNPLFPLAPGTTFVYVAGDEHIEVTVTDQRKLILGVSTVVVHDVASVEGEVAEDTFDYYAQDRDGAVWYFGEDTKTLENGQVVSTEGSWEGGVDGAKPGLIIPAAPVVGLSYRQEYRACEAEDMGEIVATCARAEVPFGSFSSCLKTLDTTPLDSSSVENKWYCPGVGIVLTIDQATGEREELIEIRR
jgi:hypothetical protein